MESSSNVNRLSDLLRALAVLLGTIISETILFNIVWANCRMEGCILLILPAVAIPIVSLFWVVLFHGGWLKLKWLRNSHFTLQIVVGVVFSIVGGIGLAWVVYFFPA